MSNSLTHQECWEIIKSHHSNLPVNVVSIADKLGISVFVAKGMDKVSGMIKKSSNSDNYEIYVNSDHRETRQRFTIAHEIAHFVLHRLLIGDGIVDDILYRSGLSNSIEAEANAYAADILMPRKQITELWQDPDTTIDGIAQQFNVSPQTVAIRLGVPN